VTGRASGPAPTPAADGVPRPRLEVEVNLTGLARPPSPAELRAISLAVEEAMRAFTPHRLKPGDDRWRLSGRWWNSTRPPWGPAASS
jgi:hypothetical protein